MPVVQKIIDDKDAQVRETALHCMGILKGRYGESIAAKYLDKVNQQKMEKINEAAKEIKPSKYDRPENYKPPAPKKVAPPKEDVIQPKKKKPEPVGDEDMLMSFDNDQKPKGKMPNFRPAPPKKARAAAGKEEPK